MRDREGERKREREREREKNTKERDRKRLTGWLSSLRVRLNKSLIVQRVGSVRGRPANKCPRDLNAARHVAAAPV